MNIFSKVGSFIMSLFFKYNVSSVTGIKTALSSDMINSIDLWNNILTGRAPWAKDAKPCGVVEATLGALANCVGEELDVESDNELLDIVIKHLNANSKELVQNMTALGGCIVRPIFTNNKMQYELIKLGNYIPTAYDLDGTLTACVITKKITENKDEFLLLERHEFKNNTHSVTSELYKIVGNALTKVALTACDKTKDITPLYTWNNVEKPFIIEFKNRVPNKIDGSDVPCALWQNTENLIEDADKQYNRINWEQEGGEMRVFADEDLFRQKQKRDKNDFAEPRITPHLNKLIIKLSGNGTDAEKIHDYAPALRTQQQVEAFNQILRRCELAWNIGKGTLSDLGEVQQTATQYTGGKKALYTLVDSIETELEEKYKHCAYVFAYMISAFTNTAFNDEIKITYNDSARKDPDAIRQSAIIEKQNGIISAAEYRQRVFGEDEETASAKVPPTNQSGIIGGFNFE